MTSHITHFGLKANKHRKTKILNHCWRAWSPWKSRQILNSLPKEEAVTILLSPNSKKYRLCLKGARKIKNLIWKLALFKWEILNAWWLMTFCGLTCSDASGGRAYKVRPDQTAQPYLEPSLPCQRAWIPVFRFFLFVLHSLDRHSKWQNQPLNSKTTLIIVPTLKSFLNTC